MMILYGDYKDMDYIQDYESGRAGLTTVEEMEKLRPYWERFTEGSISLKEKRPTDSELEQFVRIDIRHNVFSKNEYTSYAVILPGSNAYSIRQSVPHGARCFIDTDAGLYITESEHVNGKAPTSLKELKDREYNWMQAMIKRMTGKAPTDFSLKTELALNEGFKKKAPEISDPVDISDIVRDILDSLLKWRTKETQRWFHETAVSC